MVKLCDHFREGISSWLHLVWLVLIFYPTRAVNPGECLSSHYVYNFKIKAGFFKFVYNCEL